MNLYVTISNQYPSQRMDGRLFDGWALIRGALIEYSCVFGGRLFKERALNESVTVGAFLRFKEAKSANPHKFASLIFISC